MPAIDDDLKELKAVLRSLLIASSTNKEILLSTLNSMYRQEEGEIIPYRSFGFSSLEDFIHNIPDTVRLIYSNGKTYVKHVDTEKSAHITSLIKNQKKPSKRKPAFSTKYRGGYSAKSTFNNRAPPRVPSFKNNVQNNQRPVSTVPIKTTNVQAPSQQRPSCTYAAPEQIIPKPSISNSSFISVLKDVLLGMKRSPNRLPNNKGLKKSDVLSRLKHKIGENINYTISDLNSHLEHFAQYLLVDNDFIFFKDELAENKKYQNTEPPLIKKLPEQNINKDIRSDDKDMLSERTKIRLMKLMENHPEGIWCSELPDLYLSEYKLNLEYIDLGFNNITEFVTAFPDIFKVSQPDETHRLMVVCARNPHRNLEIKKKTLASIYNYNDYTSKDPDPVPINLNKEISTTLIPEGVLNREESIEQVDATSLVQDDYIEVNVSEIFTPSFFWVTLRINKKKIRDMMTELGDFYSCQDLDRYRIPQVVAAEGLNVACLYNNQWHRAIIKKIKPDGFAVVLFFDYGTVKTYNPYHLYYLHKKFSSIQAQAIPCGLHNIRPIDSSKWPRESTNRFINKVWNIPLIAMISSVDEKNNSMMISLTDTSDDVKDVHINDWMVDHRLAEFGKLFSKVPIHTLFKYDELILLNIHEGDCKIPDSYLKKQKKIKVDSENNLLMSAQERDIQVTSPPLSTSEFHTSELVTLVKESRDLSKQTNTITQAILLNMPINMKNNTECIISDLQSEDQKNFIKKPENYLDDEYTYVSEMSCDYENVPNKADEITENSLHSVPQSNIWNNENIIREIDCSKKTTDDKHNLKNFYDQSPLTVLENLHNNNQENEQKSTDYNYGYNDGTPFIEIFPSKTSENTIYNTSSNTSYHAHIIEEKENDVQRYFQKDYENNNSLKTEIDEGYSTKPSQSQTNCSLSLGSRRSSKSSIQPSMYITMTLSNRCENKLIHIIHLNDQGWVCAREFVNAFTNLKDQRVFFKLLKVLNYEVNFKHVNRESEPQLFSQLDKSEFDAPRKHDMIEHQHEVYLVPLKAVLQILAQLDFLDENVVREAIPVMKKLKNDAEDVLYEQYQNKILFDVLKLIFVYKRSRNSLRLLAK